MFHTNNLDNFSSGPHLVMVIEPEAKARFRYESEGASHGGLLGKQKGNKKKVYPTVKLEGYEGEKNVYIRVSLCTEDKEPHVFEFIGEEESTPYAREYLQEDNTATFKNLKFLSKKKEDICRILMDKKMKELRINTKSVRAQFEKKYSKEMNETARNIMNSVRLCFEAFEDDNHNIRLCEPLYSDPICNQKAASKGELKILRISAFSGSCKGGDEMILICDKVQKENIEIHFFETDSNQEIIWKGDAKFSPCDVYHQVAICFKTPPYKENANKEVSIRLARNGEFSKPVGFKYVGDYNETPSKKRKRYAKSYQSSSENGNESSSTSSCHGSSSCNAETSAYQISEQINNSEPDLLNLQDLSMSDADFSTWLSTDFHALFKYEDNKKNYSEVFQCEDRATEKNDNYGLLDSNSLCDYGTLHAQMDCGYADVQMGVVDAKQDFETSLSDLKSFNKSLTSNPPQTDHQLVREEIKGQVFDLHSFTAEEIQACIEEPVDEIDGGHTVRQMGVAATKQVDETSLSSLESGNKINNQMDLQKVKENIRRHLMKRNEFGNTFLHTAVCKLKSIKTMEFILQLIKFAHADIINEKNFYQETALQFAVEQNNVELIKTLLRHGSNPTLTNAEGNNCYHIVSEYNYVDALNSLLAVLKYSQQEDYKPKINALNYEGLTPLHISVMKHSEGCYHLLKMHSADVNIRFPQSGKALLHYAVEFHPPFVAILLKESEIEVDIQDFGGNTPLHIACATGKIEIAKQLLKAGADPSLKNYKQNYYTQDEESSEDDIDGQTPADVTTDFEILEMLKQEPRDISGQDETVQKLCELLDVDMKWKAIATFVIDEKYINSLLFDPSPTRALLQHMKKEYKDSCTERLKSVLEITGPQEALKIIQENHF